MKTFFYPLLLTSLLMASSCCTKKYCPGLTSETIRLSGFDDYEVDKVFIYRYAKTSNFTNPLDSVLVPLSRVDMREYMITTYGVLQSTQSYRIWLPSAGREYRIDNFILEKVACNSCFPVRAQSDYYDVRKSYHVNGEVRQEQGIIIKK